MGDPVDALARVLQSTGRSVVRWHRLITEDQESGPWPPTGSFGEVWVRLPRSKTEVTMLLTVAAARLDVEGRVLVFGAKDEGIRSAGHHIPASLAPFSTVLVKRRSRVLATRLVGPPPEDEGLEAWATDVTLDWGDGPRPWRYYPGVFSHGRLDPATAMLLHHLPAPAPGVRVLDYGAGTGIIGRALRDRAPDVRVDLLDPDAVALHAARTNVPKAHLLQAVSLDHAECRKRAPYDLIVSNPPIHQGKRETLDVVAGLVAGAGALLAPGGSLVLVIQRRLPAGPLLEGSFSRVEVLADEGPFRLWQAHHEG